MHTRSWCDPSKPSPHYVNYAARTESAIMAALVTVSEPSQSCSDCGYLVMLGVVHLQAPLCSATTLPLVLAEKAQSVLSSTMHKTVYTTASNFTNKLVYRHHSLPSTPQHPVCQLPSVGQPTYQILCDYNLKVFNYSL